jgi:hypothetical protein
MMKKALLVSLVTLTLLSGAQVVSATDDAPVHIDAGSGIRLLNPLGGNGGPESLPALLLSVLDFVIEVGSIVVAGMMVYVGYLFVVARGNPGKLEEARRALIYTLVGALMVLGSKAIAMGIVATVQALGGS